MPQNSQMHTIRSGVCSRLMNGISLAWGCRPPLAQSSSTHPNLATMEDLFPFKVRNSCDGRAARCIRKAESESTRNREKVRSSPHIFRRPQEFYHALLRDVPHVSQIEL
ncbi:hypothetical protein I7I53_02883 [Histoplasma capsulatum var. duboisii H88]|uniref:Uncharacterized protein n=1 Tax=Ajellomyces capsulatus (strain H88) TaxID=544711 RepID=A0A8A1LNV7_AJEC8|nr:hypothetical protein I7I53_02883 [Histoplasma capsulatum var. duboisii H88]